MASNCLRLDCIRSRARRRRSHRLRPAAIALLAFSFFAHPAAAAVEWTPYGFVRFDAIYDDSRMNHHQFPMYVLSEDASLGSENDSRANVHPRLTRLGVRVDGFDFGESWSGRALVEIDFQNGGRESREVIRMRQGYFELARGDWSFHAGQRWDVISPLYPAANNDGMMWNAGNLGDRRPQAGLAWKPGCAGGTFSLALAASQTGAVDSQDLDGNGTLDGQDATEPGLQGRLGFSRSSAGGGRFAAGAWGYRAKEETSAPVAGSREFESWVAGFDLAFFPHARIGVECEGWAGENLSDIRGGIGQGVNLATGREIASQGGWAQVVCKAHAKVTLAGGYAFDDPDDDDLANDQAGVNTARSHNEAAFGVVRVRPWSPLQLAVEYLHWTTEYVGLDRGTDNRVDAHATLYF